MGHKAKIHNGVLGTAILMISMLDITLLKVDHETEEDARPLLPYIQSCDVFGPENSGCTPADGNAIEATWLETLKLSQAAFLKTLIANIRKIPKRGIFTHSLEFEVTLAGYLFQNKKPMVILERYEVQERIKVLRTIGQSMWSYAKCIELLAKDDVDLALVYAESYMKNIEFMGSMRDQHIATNLLDVETRIREQHPEQAAKDPIKLVFILGANHSPEKYSKVPIRVVDVSNPDELAKMLPVPDAHFEYKPRDLLAYMAGNLFWELGIPVNNARLRTSSTDELKQMLRSKRRQIKTAMKARA